MFPRHLRSASVRLVVTWLAFSIMGYFWGEAIVARCIPLIAQTIEVIAPQYSGRVVLAPNEDGAQLLLDARVLTPIALGADREIPIGAPVSASADVVHVLVPLVLFFSVILATLLGGGTSGCSLSQ